MVNSNLNLEKFLLELNPFYQRNELNKFLPYYQQKKTKETSEEDNIFEANDYFFGNHLKEGIIFGVTFKYGGRIFILDRLKGKDRDKVIEHEKHHRNTSDSEYMTRKKTNTEEFYPNPIISPISTY